MEIIKHEILTVREEEVLLCVLKGLTNYEIAELLSISSHTVKAHLERLFTKLNVHNKVQLVMRAIQFGIVKV